MEITEKNSTIGKKGILRNRKTLQHKDDEFITYSNGNYLSKQWMEDVDHGNDWYDPHWGEQIPRTNWNIFWYRYFGKLPWLPFWKYFLQNWIMFPRLKYLSICIFLCVNIWIFTGCISKETCWKIIKGGQCVPIQSYEEWNRCVANCDVTLKPKTKKYNPEDHKWTRPRPYAYP